MRSKGWRGHWPSMARLKMRRVCSVRPTLCDADRGDRCRQPSDSTWIAPSVEPAKRWVTAASTRHSRPGPRTLTWRSPAAVSERVSA